MKKEDLRRASKEAPSHISDIEKATRYDVLKAIRDELFAMKGALADERRGNNVFPVIGEGSHFAKVMFVGEAPGKTEAATGRPFCGASGKFLTEMLQGIGIDRQDVYITNIVKDRPTDNRDPQPEEIALYAPFLDRQIDIIQPQVIATLGRISMAYVMSKFGLSGKLAPISKIHGKVFEVSKDELASYANYKHPIDLKVVSLYHPAVALYNGGMRTVLAQDMKVIGDMI